MKKKQLIVLTAILKMNTAQKASEILGKGRDRGGRDATEPQLSNELLTVHRLTSLARVSRVSPAE